MCTTRSVSSHLPGRDKAAVVRSRRRGRCGEECLSTVRLQVLWDLTRGHRGLQWTRLWVSDTHLGCHSEPAAGWTMSWGNGLHSVLSPPNAVSFLRGRPRLSYGVNWESSAEPRHPVESSSLNRQPKSTLVEGPGCGTHCCPPVTVYWHGRTARLRRMGDNCDRHQMPLGRGLVDLCLEPYVVNYHVYFKEKLTIEAQGGASEQPNMNFTVSFLKWLITIWLYYVCHKCNHSFILITKV